MSFTDIGCCANEQLLQLKLEYELDVKVRCFKTHSVDTRIDKTKKAGKAKASPAFSTFGLEGGSEAEPCFRTGLFKS